MKLIINGDGATKIVNPDPVFFLKTQIIKNGKKILLTPMQKAIQIAKDSFVHVTKVTLYENSKKIGEYIDEPLPKIKYSLNM